MLLEEIYFCLAQFFWSEDIDQQYKMLLERFSSSSLLLVKGFLTYNINMLLEEIDSCLAQFFWSEDFYL